MIYRCDYKNYINDLWKKIDNDICNWDFSHKLIQKQNESLSQIDEAIILLAIKNKVIKWLPVDMMETFKKEVIAYLQIQQRKEYIKLEQEEAFSSELQTNISISIMKVVINLVKTLNNYIIIQNYMVLLRNEKKQELILTNGKVIKILNEQKQIIIQAKENIKLLNEFTNEIINR